MVDDSKVKGVPVNVVDKNGVRGTIVQGDIQGDPHGQSDPQLATGNGKLLVQFQNGEQIVVPRELFIRHSDGDYHLPVSVEELMADQRSRRQEARVTSQNAESKIGVDDTQLVVPVVEERVKAETRTVETGVVEIRKRVHERTEVVDQPLHSEEVEIERVPVNRVVTEPMSIRYEGETTIIPLLEEVLVVEKRLLLREEVHIRKVHKEVHNPQEVLLREERVEITRRPATGQE